MTERIVHSNPWYSISRREEGTRTWFRVMRPDSAMILARTSQGDYVMVRGTRDTTGSNELYEFPCGAIDPGEDAATAAVREAREEAGLVLHSLNEVGRFIASPGISASACYVFTATVSRFEEQQLEPGEEWKVQLVPR